MFSPYASLFDSLLRHDYQDHDDSVVPKCNLYRQDQDYVVQVQLPGVPRDAIDILVDRGVLVVMGKADIPGTPDPAHQEFKSTQYRREFRVSDEVDVASIAAKYQDGILTLTVPRGKASLAHKISVQ